MFDRVARRWMGAGLVCVLGVMMLGADGSQDPSARFGRIGHNLMCVCSCGQVLVECNHVGCPDSKRMIGELRDQIDGGGGAGQLPGGSGAGIAADSTILNWFAAKYGATVLAAPIRGGFDNVAWIVPIAAFLLAIFGTAMVVRMWAGRRVAAVAAGSPKGRGTRLQDDAMRARIRRETEY